MTHLRIELNNIQENVNNIVIEKLYEIVSNGNLDASSNLSGLLYSPVVYKAHALYLTTMFQELTINAGDYAIPFEDPNMVTYLNSIGVGSDGMITETQAAAATIVSNTANNTTITKFNELRYFTSVTSSKNGINGSQSGNIRFSGWTALEEVDISNFTSIGHNNGNTYEDTFRGCTSLHTVTASDKLTAIGYVAFLGCTNLATFTGLSGDISIYSAAFLNCSSLTSDAFLNVTIIPVDGGNRDGAFSGCSSLTSMTLAPTATVIPQKMFYNCSNLSSINLSNILTINSEAFCACTSLTSVDLSSCTSFGSGCFNGCTSLTLAILNNSVTAIPSKMFQNCRALTTVTELGTNALTVGSFSFLNCESLNFPNVITIYPTTGGSNVAGSDVVGTFNGCKLNKVILTGGDLNLGRGFFGNCTTLTEVQGLDKIKYLSGGVFYNCPLLTGTLSFPNCVGCGTRNNGSDIPLNYDMFDGIGVTRVELPSWDHNFRDSWATFSGRTFFKGCPNLTTVLLHIPDSGFPNYRSADTRSVLFDNCPNLTTLIINNQTVPALKNTSDVVQPIDIGGTGVTLYVPDAIVNDYKTATGWSNIASQIKGMSELPQS